MNTIVNLSRKNIWRNKTRSFVILGAIAIGLFAGTYLSAFMSGWMAGTVNDEINANLSHIQIRDTAFAENNDINACFLREDVESMLGKDGLLSVAYRLNINGMLASANNAVGVQANAVSIGEEKTVFTIWQTIPDSAGFFLTEDAKNQIVISKKTAEKLKVKLKSKIVFSFQDAIGEMHSLAFRVCGIFHTTNSVFDEGNVFVRYEDIFPATMLPEGAVHVAMLNFGDISFKQIDEFLPEIKAKFPDLAVKTWKELNPAIAMSLGMVDMMAVIILGIFLLALAFGIINTMLMAVLERSQELKMLNAIGMGKRRIFSMIMLETVLLTLIGSVVGIVLATAVLIPTIRTGVDLTPLMGNNFEDYGFSSIVYPALNIKMFVEILILVVVAGVLSAIYPARKALRVR